MRITTILLYWSSWSARPSQFSTSRITHAAAKSNRAPVAPEEIKPYEEAKPSKEVQQFEEDADEAEVDENYDPMDGLSAAVRRCVQCCQHLLMAAPDARCGA